MTAVAVSAGAAAVAERLRARAWIPLWWAGGRLVVLATAAAVHFAGPRAYARHEERTHLLGLLGSWDGRWYRLVAAHGYLVEPGRQSDPAFFPLYPLLLRALHALGLGYVTAGLLVSNLALLGALLAFEPLTRALFDAQLARRATIYVAIFPLGFVFSMSYPESLVLLAIALGALAALRRRWVVAAALLAAGTLARPETLFLTLPLLPLALRVRRPGERGLALGAALAPVAALASFALYLGLALHDPLGWTHAERAWGRRFTPLGLLRAVEGLPRAVAGNAWVLRDVVFFLVYLGLLVAARRAGAPLAWVAAGAVVVVLPTFSGSFHSIGRFGLLAPAAFWGLAALGGSRRTDLLIRAASAALLVAGVLTLPFVFP
ncbi:MAG: hypothetical protein V7644_1925 [Actinomycetota bacterium]